MLRRTAMPKTRTRPRRTSHPMIGWDVPVEAAEVDDSWTAIDPEWPIARVVALRRDHYTCARCGQFGGDVHHRISRVYTDPARHNPERLITLCRACHSWAHANPTAAGVVGLIVRHETDATRVPVRFHYGLALLGEDGRVSTIAPRLGR